MEASSGLLKGWRLCIKSVSFSSTLYGNVLNRKLQANWKQIRDEAISVMNTRMFVNEAEQLREIGDWKQYEMFNRGKRLPQCERTPKTCDMIGNFEPASGCRRGQAKFSIMMPGTHIWPHCGPTNCRLRAHLGLIIPANVMIRVATETR